MIAPRRNTTTRIVYLAAVLGTAFAAGCGGGDDDGGSSDRFEGDEADVAAVVDEFAQAGHDGDGAKVCDEIFTEALTRNVEREAEQSCAAEVEANLPQDEYELEVDSVEINGQNATVDVTDQDDSRFVLNMVKTGDAWRIAGIPPTP